MNASLNPSVTDGCWPMVDIWVAAECKTLRVNVSNLWTVVIINVSNLWIGVVMSLFCGLVCWRQNKVRLLRISIDACERLGICERLLNIVSQIIDVDRYECMISHVRELVRAGRYLIASDWYGGMLIPGHCVDNC